MNFTENDRQLFIETLDGLVSNYGFDTVIGDFTRDALETWEDGLFEEFDWHDVQRGSDDDAIYFCCENLEIFHGASKMVIDIPGCDWVLKMPFMGQKENYCKREVELYNKAKCYDADQFLAEALYVGDFWDMPMYAMRKCVVNEDQLYSTLSDRYYDEGNSEEEVEKKMEDVQDCDGFFDELRWFYYDEDENSCWDEFQAKYDINDLHSGNIGFIDGRIVIIDYSGWRG